MIPSPTIVRLLLICAVITAAFSQVVAQTSAAKTSDSPIEKSDQVRLKFKDGGYLIVDDAWETPQGIWYRQGGLSHLASKDRVKAIIRGEEPKPVAKEPSENNNTSE